MEAELQKTCKPEERMFALHPDEDHIIVSHALFLMMSKPLAVKLPSLKGRYLLRKLEEEMLTACLTESDGFPELLRYCNLLYEVFPYELAAAARNAAIASKIRKLQAIGMVAAGYGGDMDDDTVDDILDDSLGIDWRIPTGKALLSEKDTKHPLLKDFETPFI